MDPDAIDRVVRKYAGELGLDRATQAHSNARHIHHHRTRNGAQLEDVRKAARIATRHDPSSTTGAGTIRRRRHHFCDVFSLDMADRD